MLKIKIIEFHYCIWNHHGKCIQMSANIPGIGSSISEISEISEVSFECNQFWQEKKTTLHGINGRVQSVNLDMDP